MRCCDELKLTGCFAFGLSVLLIQAGIYRNCLKTEVGEDSLLQPKPLSHTTSYVRSPNIENILKQSRTNIKIALKNYNFTHSGVHKLEDLLMESGGKPIRNIILATWRTGSTFLGEVLNAMPANFYHYEPLLMYGDIQFRWPPQADKAISTITSMLKCDYSNMKDYFEFGRTHIYQFNHNTRLWKYCKQKNNTKLQVDANFTARFCKLFPFQSMKVVRLRLHLVKKILEDKELNVKVVLLIRDPRAVMQSRQHRTFCPPAPDRSKPELLCADMISDYVAAKQIFRMYPDKLIVVRYEELALNPEMTALQLLQFLRLSATPSVHKFIRVHTTVENARVSSTFKVSRNVPYRWKYILNYTYVEEIQEKCNEAMKLWGYKKANNASHMASKEFYPLEPYSVP